MMAYTLKNFVTIITGAGTGIGQATALKFAQCGSKLSLTGRTVQTLQETKELVLNSTDLKEDDVLLLQADMADNKDLEEIVHKTVEHFGGIDVLVNNAGHFLQDTVENFNEEHFNSMMRVHVSAVMQLTSLASPHLIKKNGCVVNVASIAAMRPFPNCLSYCATKAAVVHMTKSMADELGPKGVRVNAVNPGYVPTEILTRSGMPQEALDYLQEQARERMPLRRVCKPSEIASVISFLASPDASYITGVCLPVEGGVRNTLRQ